jgi:fructan beta-fructosidase
MNVDGQPDEKKWILKVDVNHSILGQYFIGHFDGIRFISDHPSDHVLRVDYGKDFYAAQSWSDEPKGRRLWIGWMNNWDYANIIPTSSWRGLFSVPRELHLQQSSDGLRLVQQPIKELEQLRQSIFHTTNADVSTINARLSELTMDIAQEILVEFDLDTARELGIKIHTNRLEETVIGYDVQAREMFVDRRNSGNSIFSPVFARLHCAPLRPDHNKITLRVFLDSCSVEVFGNDGQAVISDLIFPDPQNVGMEVYAAGGDVQLKVLEIWKLSDAT